MDPTINGMDPLEIDEDFVAKIRKEIEEDIKSTTCIGASTLPSVNDLVSQKIRSKLQISEWSVHMPNELSKRSSLEVQAKMNDLRSEANRTKLQEKMSCSKGEDEFKVAQHIFEAIEEGNLVVFKNLMEENVKDWNFQLEEYGNLTPLLWAILHGQREIVKVIREHAVAKNSSRTMFLTFDKFGFKIMNVAVFAYLIVPESRHKNVKRMFNELLDWEEKVPGHLGYMDSQSQKAYPPCKVYYSMKDMPTCYYVDDLGHLGGYMTPLHLATWFAPYQVAIKIIEWRIKDLKRPTGNGHTVFHLSSWKRRHDILRWLIHFTKCSWDEIPLDIGNFSDNDRQSALHFAVLSQNEKCVGILLRTDAIKVTIRNWKGYTPMEIATVLYSDSPSTITTKDLEHFGVTSFKIKSLGLTSDDENVNFQNFTRNGIHSIEYKKDRNALKNIISMFNGLDPEALQKDRQVFVDAANAILVGAALIASASFGAWLQPPLGYMEYYSNEFLVTQPAAPPETYQSFVAIKQHWIIQLFWIFNSLSFFFSIATVIAGADAAFPKKDLILKDAVTSVRHGVILASYLLFLSVLCVIGTFSTIGFAILPPISKYRVNMYCTMAIGLATCGVVLIRFLQKLQSSLSLRSWCTKN